MTPRSMRFMPHQWRAIYSPYRHTAMFAGVGAGKTTTGSHFVIKQICDHPELSGLVGANTNDQLVQATLRELFYWLETYGFAFTINKRPPMSWGEQRRTFKDYSNILSVKTSAGVTFIFTRVLSKGDNLRGLTLSWAWLDEARDTPKNTHDVVLSRLRESEHIRTLLTTTPNGEDWAYERFVLKGNDSTNLYGSMHVPTIAAVEAGIIPRSYYETMRGSYSPLYARQELDAEHVNTVEGRAYYSAGEWNKAPVSPWGEQFPTRDRALIIGVDFNFNPAPMSWTFSQEGWLEGEDESRVHTFAELARSNMGTREMTRLMLSMFPGFHYQFYGDASGQNRTTSNAGESDHVQIAEELNEAGVSYSLDFDQANPRIRDRVENVNRLCRNALGETFYTFNPETCPTLSKDLDQTQWKESGKLDAGKDGLLTHASDSLGYALWKVKPFGRGGGSIMKVETMASKL